MQSASVAIRSYTVYEIATQAYNIIIANIYYNDIIMHACMYHVTHTVQRSFHHTIEAVHI